MMLMRENLKKSMIQSVNSNVTATLDLTLAGTKQKTRSSLDGSSSSSTTTGGFVCSICGRTYKLKSSLRNHQKWECGKEPQFKCPFCIYKAKQKMHMARHMERMHREIDYSAIKTEVKSEIKEVGENAE